MIRSLQIFHEEAPPTGKVSHYEDDAALLEELPGGNDTDGGKIPYLEHIIRYLLTHSNATGATIDFRLPYIKTSLRYVYPLFILLHAVVCVGGLCGNAAVLAVIVRRKLYRSPTFFFLGNLALSDLLKGVIVLPITVMTQLCGNWVFGSFICFLLPMMHSFPVHASMLTYMVIAVDRYRLIIYPMKTRVPAGLCVIAVWTIGVCVVLPYVVYVKYIDLGSILGSEFQGVGLCWVHMPEHIQEYIRATFVVMYCLPLSIMAFLFVKVSAEIKGAENPSMSIEFDQNVHSNSDGTSHTHLQWSDGSREERSTSHLEEPRCSNTYHPHSPLSYPDPDEEDDIEINIDFRKEKRTQKYLISMVVLFAMCWCPINILGLVNHLVLENEDNAGHLDVTYLTFTFFGFMSTCTNPILFASWCMSDQTKERLKGYFRFSTKRRQRRNQRNVCKAKRTSTLHA